MEWQTNLPFNPAIPTTMHIDINSCFATIEQQANPFLRGKPLVVAAYPTLSGCILASSIEAKKLGIKVGMKVKDGKSICPSLVVLSPDPAKYRFVHWQLRRLLRKWTDKLKPKSIDEFVLGFAGHKRAAGELLSVGQGIKRQLKKKSATGLRFRSGSAQISFWQNWLPI